MIMIYFNFQHNDNLAQAKPDKKCIKKISRKLNIRELFILIPFKHLENQLYFDQQFDQIFLNNHQIDLVIIIIGGRALLRLNPDQVQILQQIKYICVFTSDIAAKDQNFQQNVHQRVLHAKIEHSETQLQRTIQQYQQDYKYHLNDQHDLIDLYYYFPDIEQE
ncbi:hypothetical protein pb186bvf_014953 [Paramecium bursaria]